MTRSDITDEEWQRIRRHFGDLAYEHPEMHRMMLDLLDMNDLDKALETATDELRTNFKRRVFAAYADGRLSHRQLLVCARRGWATDAAVIGSRSPRAGGDWCKVFSRKPGSQGEALEVLSRAPDVPAEPDDELK